MYRHVVSPSSFLTCKFFDPQNGHGFSLLGIGHLLVLDRINRIDRIIGGRLAGAQVRAIALVMVFARLLAASLAAAVVEPRLERLDAQVFGDRGKGGREDEAPSPHRYSSRV